MGSWSSLSGGGRGDPIAMPTPSADVEFPEGVGETPERPPGLLCGSPICSVALGGGVMITTPPASRPCSRATWSRRWMIFVPPFRSASSMAAPFSSDTPRALDRSSPPPIPHRPAAVDAVVRTMRSADLPSE